MANRGEKTRHEGVYRLPDGRWRIQATTRLGDRIVASQKTLPAHVPLREVNAARAELVLSLVQTHTHGVPPVPAMSETRRRAREKPNTTVSDFAERWLARKKLEVRPHTLEGYCDVLCSRILPVLGHVPIAELSREHILGWRAWAQRQVHQRGGPLTPATLTGWWRVLRAMLNDLIADHGLEQNLTFRVRPPTSDKARVRTDAALTADELGRVLAVVRTDHPEWFAEVYTLALAGMRPSELYALTWGDVDLADGTLYIGKSYVRGHTGRPKKDRARRIGLTEEMVGVLQAHFAAQPGPPEAPVFRGTTGRRRDTTSLYAMLRAAGEKAGVPFRVGNQVLRYTANTLLREVGVPDEIVRARLGHVTREMGHRYFKGHLDAQREATEKMQSAVAHPGRRQVKGQQG